MEINELKEIIKRGTAFQKSGYMNKDLAATLIVKFQDVKDANVLSKGFDRYIDDIIFFKFGNNRANKDLDILLTALKAKVRKE